MLLLVESKEQSLLPEFPLKLFQSNEFSIVNETIDITERFKVCILYRNGLIDCDTHERLLFPNHREADAQYLIERHQSKLIAAIKAHDGDVFMYIRNADKVNTDMLNQLGVNVLTDLDALRQCIVKTSTIASFNFDKCTIFRSGVSGEVDLRGTFRSNQNVGASLAYINDKKPKLLDMFLSILDLEPCFLDNGIVTFNGKQSKSKQVIIPTPTETLLAYKRIVDRLQPEQAKKLSIVVVDDIIDQQEAEKIISDNKDLILYLCARADVMLPIHACHKFKKRTLVEHAKRMLSILDYPDGLRLAVPTKKTLKTGLGEVKPRLDIEQIKQLLDITKPNVKTRYFPKVHFLALTEVTDSNPDQFPLFIRLLTCAERGIQDVSMDGQRISALFGCRVNSNRQGSRIQRHIEQIQREMTVKADPIYIKFNDSWADDPCIFEYFLNKIEASISSAIDFKSKFNRHIDNLIEGDCQKTISESFSKIMLEFPANYIQEIENCLKSIFWDEISQLRPFNQSIELQSKYREQAISLVLNQETMKPQRDCPLFLSNLRIAKKQTKQERELHCKRQSHNDKRISFISRECYYQSF